MILGIWVRLKRYFEEGRARLRYWRHRAFREGDRKLFKADPYRVSRDYLRERGESQIHTYGETPLTTLDKIITGAGILPNDHLYDLGCGPGRTSLWIHTFVGCRVTGVERIPTFIESAVEMPGLRYLNRDILDVDYSDASAIYFYGTGWPEPELHLLAEKLKVLEPGSCIITVSYPWSDYSDDERLALQRVVRASFPWGRTDVYIMRITGDPGCYLVSPRGRRSGQEPENARKPIVKTMGDEDSPEDWPLQPPLGETR